MKLLRLWIPVFVWCALIFTFSNIPQVPALRGLYDFVLKKIAHFCEYFILVFLLYRAFKGSFDLKAFYLIFWPFILAFLYAVSDELHQHFVPNRHATVTDVLIDTCGILAFLMLIKYNRKLREKIMFWA